MTLPALALIAAAAAILRLLIGLHLPFDADEAVEGIAAGQILHGRFVLMESNAHYLGALDSYVLAPFIAIFGHTIAAIRIGLSSVGAIYVVAMFWLGRLVFGRDREALVMALVAAVFPLFALTYGIKARTYGVLLPLEVLVLALTIRVAWSRAAIRTRDWVVLGVVAGLSAWQDVLLVIPIGVALLALIARGSAPEWRPSGRGIAALAASAAIGFSPWIIYNAQTRLGSLRHLYTPLKTYSIPTLEAAKQVLAAALPIFVGARVNFCGPVALPAPVIDLVLALLTLSVIWLRRGTLLALAQARFAAIEPVDIVLLVAPLAVLAVTVRFFNSLSCEPRYLMPLAVPLVTVMVVLLAGPVVLRSLGMVALIGFVLLSALTVQRQVALYDNLVVVPNAPQIRLDWQAAASTVENQHAEAIWAQYWLARPLEYVTGDRVVIGEYGGYVGFPDMQTAALHTAHSSWLFVAGSRDISAFEKACASRGVTYQRVPLSDGLVLYKDLSDSLLPSDLGFQTQSIAQAR